MTIYVFGNEDFAEDKHAFDVMRELQEKTKNINFVVVKPNEDVPFINEPLVIILDTIQGIDEVTLIEGDLVDKILMPPRSSVHDFDLAFQLKYLKKLGRLGEIKIIGLPQQGEIIYERIYGILDRLAH